MKQNFDISCVRTVVLKARKFDNFRELYQKEPEMVALRVRKNYRYL